MKMKVTKLVVFAVAMIGLLTLGSCNFEEIVQPATATAGQQITVNLTVSTEDSDANKKWGLLGLFIPNDWVVDTVYYEGDLGEGGAHFLHPDSADNYASNWDYHWGDSMNTYIASVEGMRWEVWESDSGTAYTSKSYIDITVEMTVGNTNGTFDIGYLFTDGATELSDLSWGEQYCDSLGNAITVTGGTAINNEVPMVNEFKLSQNFPNPFNPTTNIQFEIPENAFVTMSVFDLMGHEVSRLVNDYREAGSYNVTLDGSNLSSGIYFYKLQAGGLTKTMKMVLSK